MDRAGVDDGATAPGTVHVPQAGSRGEKGSVKMDGHDLLPVAEGELVDAANDLVAGVAAENVDAAVFANGFCDCFLHCIFVGHVDGQAEQLATRGRRELGCCSLRLRLLKIGDHDLGALGGKALGNAAADARSRAGDDCCFSLETHVLPYGANEIGSFVGISRSLILSDGEDRGRVDAWSWVRR